MTIEELLASRGLRQPKFYEASGSSGGPGLRSLSLDDITPNTAYGDSRPPDLQPEFNPNLIQGTVGGAYDPSGATNQLAVQSNKQQYAQNYVNQLASPYKQGPFPNFEAISKDPKWWELYQTNQPVADRIFGAVHGKSFTQAIQDDQEQKDLFKKTIFAKISGGNLRQDVQGNWQEILDQPDPNGLEGMKKVIGPISVETAGMLAKLGGPQALGLPDVRQMAVMKAANLNTIKPPVVIPPSESVALEMTNHPAGLFGQGGVLPNLQQNTQKAVYSGLIQNMNGPRLNLSLGDSFKNLATNVLGSDITGRNLTDPVSVTPDNRNERQMINILRDQKGLGPISDQMWNEYQTNRAAKQSNRVPFNSP